MHRSFLLLAFVQLCSALLLGQAKLVNAGSPPKYLQIVLEEVRGGSMMAHKHRAAHGATPKASGITVHYLRASSIAGPNGALWFLMYESLRDLEKQMQEEAANPTRDSGPVSGYSKMLARRRDDLSYRPDFNLGEYKFFAVHTFYSKLAHARDAMEVFKILNDAREKSGL